MLAIELATGKVLWTHTYNSPNGGPDGVNVAGGTVYAATNHAPVVLSAATGRQLWSRTLTRNDHEGIDMAPGTRCRTCGDSRASTPVAASGTLVLPAHPARPL